MPGEEDRLNVAKELIKTNFKPLLSDLKNNFTRLAKIRNSQDKLVEIQPTPEMIKKRILTALDNQIKQLSKNQNLSTDKPVTDVTYVNKATVDSLENLNTAIKSLKPDQINVGNVEQIITTARETCYNSFGTQLDAALRPVKREFNEADLKKMIQEIQNEIWKRGEITPDTVDSEYMHSSGQTKSSVHSYEKPLTREAGLSEKVVAEKEEQSKKSVDKILKLIHYNESKYAFSDVYSQKFNEFKNILQQDQKTNSQKLDTLNSLIAPPKEKSEPTHTKSQESQGREKRKDANINDYRKYITCLDAELKKASTLLNGRNIKRGELSGNEKEIFNKIEKINRETTSTYKNLGSIVRGILLETKSSEYEKLVRIKTYVEKSLGELGKSKYPDTNLTQVSDSDNSLSTSRDKKADEPDRSTPSLSENMQEASSQVLDTVFTFGSNLKNEKDKNHSSQAKENDLYPDDFEQPDHGKLQFSQGTSNETTKNITEIKELKDVSMDIRRMLTDASEVSLEFESRVLGLQAKVLERIEKGNYSDIKEIKSDIDKLKEDIQDSKEIVKKYTDDFEKTPNTTPVNTQDENSRVNGNSSSMSPTNDISRVVSPHIEIKHEESDLTVHRVNSFSNVEYVKDNKVSSAIVEQYGSNMPESSVSQEVPEEIPKEPGIPQGNEEYTGDLKNFLDKEVLNEESLKKDLDILISDLNVIEKISTDAPGSELKQKAMDYMKKLIGTQPVKEKDLSEIRDFIKSAKDEVKSIKEEARDTLGNLPNISKPVLQNNLVSSDQPDSKVTEQKNNSNSLPPITLSPEQSQERQAIRKELSDTADKIFPTPTTQSEGPNYADDFVSNLQKLKDMSKQLSGTIDAVKTIIELDPSKSGGLSEVLGKLEKQKAVVDKLDIIIDKNSVGEGLISHASAVLKSSENLLSKVLPDKLKELKGRDKQNAFGTVFEGENDRVVNEVPNKLPSGPRLGVTAQFTYSRNNKWKPSLDTIREEPSISRSKSETNLKTLNHVQPQLRRALSMSDLQNYRSNSPLVGLQILGGVATKPKGEGNTFGEILEEMRNLNDTLSSKSDALEKLDTHRDIGELGSKFFALKKQLESKGEVPMHELESECRDLLQKNINAMRQIKSGLQDHSVEHQKKQFAQLMEFAENTLGKDSNTNSEFAKYNYYQITQEGNKFTIHAFNEGKSDGKAFTFEYNEQAKYDKIVGGEGKKQAKFEFIESHFDKTYKPQEFDKDKTIKLDDIVAVKKEQEQIVAKIVGKDRSSLVKGNYPKAPTTKNNVTLTASPMPKSHGPQHSTP